MAQVPLARACSSGGSACLMVLNFATGAAFPLPELDVTGDGKLDLSDVYTDIKAREWGRRPRCYRSQDLAGAVALRTFQGNRQRT